MKTILLSLHQKWWDKILTGEKVLEIRKTHPSEKYSKYKVIVYVTGGVGVVGEFICDEFLKVRTIPDFPLFVGVDNLHLYESSCLTKGDLQKYSKGSPKPLWAWHISHVKDYGFPRPLSEYGIKRPPMSWMYIE